MKGGTARKAINEGRAERIIEEAEKKWLALCSTFEMKKLLGGK
jgi:hypothetical protein